MPSPNSVKNDIYLISVDLILTDDKFDQVEDIKKNITRRLRDKYFGPNYYSNVESFTVQEFVLARLKYHASLNDLSIGVADYREYEGSLGIAFTLYVFSGVFNTSDDVKNICDRILNYLRADFGILDGIIATINYSPRLGFETNLGGNPIDELQRTAKILQDNYNEFTKHINSLMVKGYDWNKAFAVLIAFLLGSVFYLYNEKSELEEKIELRKQVTDYLTEINTFKESGVNTSAIKKDSNIVSKEKPPMDKNNVGKH